MERIRDEGEQREGTTEHRGRESRSLPETAVKYNPDQ
jgi:hypothetical protein